MRLDETTILGILNAANVRNGSQCAHLGQRGLKKDFLEINNLYRQSNIEWFREQNTSKNMAKLSSGRY